MIPLKKIDIGCGAHPMPDAQVFTDLYPLKTVERSQGKVVIPQGKKFVLCDVEKMPFSDKEFDYAYCRQVLEHTLHPEKACAEIMRIAKAGLIETPTHFAEIFFGWPYHKWIIIERNQKLFFFQKRKNEDRPFGNFFRIAAKFNPVIKIFLKRYPHLFKITFHWKNKFAYEVIREKNVSQKSLPSYKQRWSELKISRLIYWLWDQALKFSRLLRKIFKKKSKN